MFEGFLGWLRTDELAARPDAARVAGDLAEAVARILAGAGDLDGRRVLDLGAGTGALAFAAVDRGARVVALDLDEEALGRGRALATRLGAGIRHVRADARALPFAGASFEVSLHRSVLVAMDAPGSAVVAERMAMVSGGRVSCSETLGRELDLVAEDPGIDRVWRGLQRVLAGSGSYAFTERGLVALYEHAGFEEVGARRWDREVLLDGEEAVARAFAASPAAGLSARAAWERAGVPGPLLDELLARLALEAERGRPVRLVAPECFVTARAPSS
jgi:SAM-dependent methyltransferase